MRISNLLVSSAFVLGAFISPTAEAQTVQVGTPQVGQPGGDCLLFQVNCFNRAQHIYAASYFTSGPMMINAISFYGLGNQIGGNFEFRLSTSQNAVGSGSSIFANNIGADEQVFYNGAMPTNVGGVWTFLGTPFFYDPSQGDLLLDEFKTGASGGPVNQNDSPLQIERFYSVGVNDVQAPYYHTGYGPVTTFETIAVVATPEPASLVLMATGLVGMMTVARRRRNA